MRILLLGCALLSVPLPAIAQQSVEARLAAYRERVERLEDHDAVENLQAYFGYYFDKGLWDEVTDLFAANGSFEHGQRGVYIGQDRIRRALLLFGPEEPATAQAPGSRPGTVELRAQQTARHPDRAHAAQE